MKGKALFSSANLQLDRRRLWDWTRRGLLLRLHEGVYRFADQPSYNPMELASLIAPTSYITGRTALSYHSLLIRENEGMILGSRHR